MVLLKYSDSIISILFSIGGKYVKIIALDAARHSNACDILTVFKSAAYDEGYTIGYFYITAIAVVLIKYIAENNKLILVICKPTGIFKRISVSLCLSGFHRN